MAKFRFNLEHVLEQRKRAERDAQIAFAEIDRERVDLENRIRGFQHSIVGFKRDLRGALAGEQRQDEPGAPVTLPDVRLQAGASLMVMGKAQATVVELAGVHKRLEEARTALLDAARARQAVELLKEHRYEQWKKDQARREAMELDDMATMRHGRTAGAPVAPVLRKAT